MTAEKISSVRIQNFRSVADVTIYLQDHSVLLGPNNSGKSNILRAIEFGCSPSHASVSDYRNENIEQDVDIKFWFFGEDGPLVGIRKRCDWPGASQVRFHHMSRRPKDAALRLEHILSLSRAHFSGHPSAEHVPSPRPGDDALSARRVALARYLREEERSIVWEEVEGAEIGRGDFGDRDDPRGGGPEGLGPIWLPRTLFLAAGSGESATDPHEGDRLMRQLMRDVVQGLYRWLGSGGEREREIPDEIAHAMSLLRGATRAEFLRDFVAQLQASLGPLGAGVHLGLAQDEPIEFLAETLGIQFDRAGRGGRLAQAGDGVRRSVAFAAMEMLLGVDERVADDERSLAKLFNSAGRLRMGRPVLYLVEEPELYLHPHGERALASKLRRVSSQGNAQVVLGSHSPRFVRMQSVAEIARVRRLRDGATTAVQCSPRFARSFAMGSGHLDVFDPTHWISQERAEMFFAEKLLLVEGHTDVAVVSYLSSRWRIPLGDLSVVNCGGKTMIPRYAKIAREFGMPCFALFDEDRMPDGAFKDAGAAALNDEIVHAICPVSGGYLMFPIDLERYLGIPDTPKRKRAKPSEALAYLDRLPTLDGFESLRSLLLRATGGAAATSVAADPGRTSS